jgi:hypothetical protein
MSSALIGGATIGFFVILAIVAAALMLAGTPVAGALGTGALVALVGGPGFGTMFGATYYVHRAGDHF